MTAEPAIRPFRPGRLPLSECDVAVSKSTLRPRRFEGRRIVLDDLYYCNALQTRSKYRPEELDRREPRERSETPSRHISAPGTTSLPADRGYK